MKKPLCAFFSLVFLTCIFQHCLYAQTGTWTQVATNAPHANEGVMLLLTDGTVICHTTQGGGDGTGWDRLTPDSNGSYVNGTWSTIAQMHNTRLFFSSQVLPSGKVYVAGGEYGNGTSKGEVYDPATNTWTLCGAIPNNWKIYDGNSEILYNGNVLEGPQIGTQNSYNILLWSPATLNYTVEANAPLNHDEASWLKLPDSSVLYIGINSQNSCRYIPQTNRWVNDATVPNNIYDPWGEESGCALMLPNGKAIFFGSSQYNAIYTPSGDSLPGVWSVAANFPTINGAVVGQVDAPGAMMVNGHILLAVCPGNSGSNDQFRDPVYFLEYNYVKDTFTQVTSIIPGLGADSIAGVTSNFANFLDLPDGTVLMGIDQESISKEYWVYTPGSGPIPQGIPTINTIIPIDCSDYKITGKLFNGISEGAAFGDDWQESSNYPLVRLTHGNRVYYAKTSNWNRIGAVQTDSLEDTATFTLPAGLPGGTTYSLVVVVNGFASKPTLFTTLGTSLATVTYPSCNGQTGSATLNSAIGGTSPYTYKWAPSGGSTLTATGLSAGNYTVTVTDHNGCTATLNVALTQPAALTVSIAKTNAVCNGGNNGKLVPTPSGGTTPYTYLWTPGGATTATYSGLSAGTYTLIVKDRNGCSLSASATITQSAAVPAVTITSHTDVSTCYGANMGSASSNTTGGTLPYTYNWTPTGGTNLSASNLSGGTYTITVTDNNGCTATASVTITQPPQLLVVIDSVNVDSIQGFCNGQATVNASGGIAPYTYIWSPGGGTNDTINGKCPGQYCCTITDNNGCSKTSCVTIQNVTGVSAIMQNAAGINIYPNPARGAFTITGTTKGQILELYNDLGQKLSSYIVGNSTESFAISGNPNGLYLIRILNSNGSVVAQKKIMKTQ